MNLPSEDQLAAAVDKLLGHLPSEDQVDPAAAADILKKAGVLGPLPSEGQVDLAAAADMLKKAGWGTGPLVAAVEILQDLGYVDLIGRRE